jgi:hypothetical protein
VVSEYKSYSYPRDPYICLLRCAAALPTSEPLNGHPGGGAVRRKLIVKINSVVHTVTHSTARF